MAPENGRLEKLDEREDCKFLDEEPEGTCWGGGEEGMFIEKKNLEKKDAVGAE